MRARPILASLAFGVLPVVGIFVGAFTGGPEKAALSFERNAIVAAILFVVTALLTYSFLRFSSGGASAPTQAKQNSGRLVGGALVGFAVMAAFSLPIAERNGAPLADLIRFDLISVAVGFAATAPLALLLILIMKSDLPLLRNFRDRQIRLFAERNFDLSFGQVLIMSAGAGIAEEMLFRGALQPLFQGWLGGIGGLVAASFLFGLAHAANIGYFLVSSVVGLWLGWLFMMTGNLLTPMIAHGVYDVLALQVTATAVRAYNAQIASDAGYQV